MSSATVTMTCDGQPPTASKLLKRPGLIFHRLCPAGGVDALWCDPALQFCYEHDIPVIVEFEQVADAVAFQRDLDARPCGVRQ